MPMAALAALQAEAEVVKSVVNEAATLLDRVEAINETSADCIPSHVVLRLQRERIEAEALLDEINAVLDFGRAAAPAPMNG